MRGSPLLQLLGLVIALGLLAFPLHYLTSAPRIETPPSNSDATPSNVRQVELKLVSSAVPYSFEIQFLGKPLWTGTAQRATDTRTVRIPFPPEGVDLTIEARWSNPGMAALQLTVTPADQPPLSQTLWGDGKVSDTITLREGTQ
ncbi:MAG TPA: hypothetical protein VN957_29790 [Chthoniobacterales bacterium]|jgi:hypothetical protein|nr:hypothetical protein [Chthoniobacterales bacterium]